MIIVRLCWMSPAGWYESVDSFVCRPAFLSVCFSLTLSFMNTIPSLLPTNQNIHTQRSKNPKHIYLHNSSASCYCWKVCDSKQTDNSKQVPLYKYHLGSSWHYSWRFCVLYDHRHRGKWVNVNRALRCWCTTVLRVFLIDSFSPGLL